MGVSRLEYADLVRQRVMEAAIGYYDVLEAKALRDLAREELQHVAYVEDVTRQAIEAGDQSPIEPSRIRLERLQSEQQLRDAENALTAATARLGALMGQTLPTAAFDVAGSIDATPAAAPLPVDEAYGLALAQRPDLAALRANVQRAISDADLERRTAHPEVATRVGYTRQFQEKAIGFPDANSWGLGVDMSLPVHDRNQGNRARAASVAAQAAAELDAGKAVLLSEIVQASADLRTSAENAQAVADEQLRLAEQVRDDLIAEYRAGSRPLIEELDAQRSYRATVRAYISSRANHARAAIRYNAALGNPIAPPQARGASEHSPHRILHTWS